MNAAWALAKVVDSEAVLLSVWQALRPGADHAQVHRAVGLLERVLEHHLVRAREAADRA